MSKQQLNEIRPIISIIIIIAALFSIVFLQMESRRLGYVVLKQTREYKNLRDEFRLQSLRYAKTTRPERMRDVAIQRLTMGQIRTGQIIHLSGDSIALRQ